jgi:ribokinase
MLNRPKIVVVGSANTDLVLQVPRLPRAGETVTSSHFFQALGGKGANQAVAAARLGADVTFVCKVGRDDYGRMCYQAYQNEGMNLEFAVWDESTATGVAFVFVSDSSENLIGVAPGANMHLTVDEVRRAEEAIAAADCLLVQLEVPHAADLAAMQIARRHHIPIILNPAPPAPFPLELLDQADILTPNETELEFILKHLSPPEHSQDGLAWLTLRVPNLVITLGAQGCRVLSGGLDQSIPAFRVQAVDTTAAGDAFNGGLAVATARGLPLADAVRFASVVGAISVTRLGAMNSLPTASEVDEFLAQHA